MTEPPADHTLELLRRIDGKLDRQDERLTTLGSDVSTIRTDMSETNRRLTSLEATTHGIADDVRLVRNTMSAMERAHAAQVETSASLMERMDRTEDTLASLARRLEAVERDH